MLSFSALVAGSFSLGSRIANEIDPAALTLARFAIAVVSCAVAAQLVGPGFKRIHFRAPWRWLALGAIYAIYFVMMFQGLKTADPVATSAVFTLQPILTGIIGYIVLRQITTPRMALALAIGAAGALWVIFRADLGALMRFDIGKGEFIFFIGSVFHAALPVMIRLLTRGEPQLVTTTLMLAGGGIVLLPWGIGPALQTDWAALSGLAWLTLLYVAVVASGATSFLMSYSSQRLPGAKLMAYTYLVPSWVICWEIALGGTVPPAMVLVGVALTIVALLMLLKDEAK